MPSSRRAELFSPPPPLVMPGRGEKRVCADHQRSVEASSLGLGTHSTRLPLIIPRPFGLGFGPLPPPLLRLDFFPPPGRLPLLLLLLHLHLALLLGLLPLRSIGGAGLLTSARAALAAPPLLCRLL